MTSPASPAGEDQPGELDWNAMATVGRIVRPHGNKGHVVVWPETDFGAERFGPGATVHCVRRGVPAALTIVASREHQGRWVVGFEGVTTIDGAEGYRGLELRIPAVRMQTLGEGIYYAHDLAGCAVETVDGIPVGRVESVMLGSGVPLLVIAASRGEVLVPLAEDICRRIDVAAKVIVIDPPDGLIDLNWRPVAPGAESGRSSGSGGRGPADDG